jgi:hypothetical protein
MKKALAFALALTAAACGSASSPTSPTQAIPGSASSPTSPTQAIPLPSIVSSGPLTETCPESGGCSFAFQIVNNGPGCASPSAVSGTLWIVDETGRQQSFPADWTLSADAQALGLLRPGHTRAVTGTGLRDGWHRRRAGQPFETFGYAIQADAPAYPCD